jgi:hypothetical protein
MIKEFFRINDDAIAAESYEYFSRITPAKPYPAVEGVRGILEEIAASEPSAKNVKPDYFVDSGFISKLDQSGFIDGLYRRK